MTTSTSTKNGEQAEAELEFDVSELREELGVNALEEEVKMLRELLGEVLTYTNYVDVSLQELQGEGVVTERLQYNVGRGGRLEFQRQRPPTPANLTRAKLSLVSAAKED